MLEAKKSILRRRELGASESLGSLRRNTEPSPPKKGMAGFSAVPELSGRAFFADHLESQVHDQLAVVIGDAAEEVAQAFEEFGRFAGAAPLVLACGHARWKRRNFRRGFPVVEKLVHRNFES